MSGVAFVSANESEAVFYWKASRAPDDEMGERYTVTWSAFTAAGVFGMTWTHMRRPFAEFVGCVQLSYLETHLLGTGAVAFVRTFWRRFVAAIQAMEVLK